MGTKKFKLSDMIPNAWFYKLKDMNKTSKTHHIKNKHKHKHNHNNHLLPPPPPPSSTVKTPPRPDPQCSSRKSYYVARELTIDLPNEIDSTPPRKSARSRKSNRRSSSISTCSIPSSLSPPFRSYQSPPSPPSPKETDILGKDVGFFAEDALLDVHKQSILSRYALADEQNQPEHFNIDIGVDKMSLHTTSIDLPPIITKQKPKPKPNGGRTSMTINSPGGVRLRMNSPRIVGRKQGQNGHKIIGRKSTSSKKRRSISESFAVVKTSFDPQGDFKESMVEMVLQNNLTAAKDLEDLLACYLSLNSDEYHDVIIKVFKQIWIDLRRPQ